MEDITITINKINSSIRITRGENLWGENPGHRYANPTPASRARIMRLVEGIEPKEGMLATTYKL